MSCSNCCTKYNFFFREHGCPVCHMSLCSKCLPEKLPFDGKKHSVCRKCYNKATTIEDEAPPLVPPKALERRLDELENPARPPITVYRQSPRVAGLKRGLSRQDSELVDRLEALKADRKAKHVPTESEMAARLAVLKGEPCPGGAGPSGSSSNLPPPERRSAAQQEHDLLAQTRDQLSIAARYRPEEGLQERLARLRGAAPAAAAVTGGASEAAAQQNTQSPECGDTSLPPPVGSRRKRPAHRGCRGGQKVRRAKARLRDEQLAAAGAGDGAAQTTTDQLPPSTDGQSPADLVAAVSAELAAEVGRANQIAQKVADIHHRLEDVKGVARDGQRGGPADPDKADPTEDQEVQRLIKQISEQAALEDKELDEELESISSVEDEELPWCCICNADATVRCSGCSGDLYCRSCFREGHEDELRDHQWSSFPDSK